MADRCLLLVEGVEDQHVFRHLFRHYGIRHEFFASRDIEEGVITIKHIEGVGNLRDTLLNYVKGSGQERLGIVVDVDRPEVSRWDSIRNALRDAGYARVPRTPVSAGTIVRQDGRQTVGAWIMPDNVSLAGMLEDFAASLIEPSDPLWMRAGDVVEQLPRPWRFPPGHRRKAHIHTWLAWQEEPGTPLGWAITKGYFKADAPPAQRLIAWIRRLFPDAAGAPQL